MLRFCLLFLTTLLPLFSSYAETISGPVIHVADGDTITILSRRRKQIKIRLGGIDAPERKQAYGTQAKYTLADLVFGKEVRVETETLDRYGRTVGTVYDTSGRNINELMVEEGYAWWYWKVAPDQHVLKQKERRARDSHLGLWQDSDPIPPWEFRYSGGPDVQALFRRNIIIGNIRSRIYHTPGCSTYARVSARNRRHFTSPQEAEQAGYRKAKNCN